MEKSREWKWSPAVTKIRCLQDLLEDRESNPTSGISNADANERDGSDSSEDAFDDDPANSWRLEKRYENLDSIGFSPKVAGIPCIFLQMVKISAVSIGYGAAPDCICMHIFC